MSEALLQMFATIQAINAALVDLVKISTPILLVLGNFGEISSVIVFVQRTFRTNSCAIYLLAASCIRLLFINFTILTNYLAVGKLVNIVYFKELLEFYSPWHPPGKYIISGLQANILYCLCDYDSSAKFCCSSLS